MKSPFVSTKGFLFLLKYLYNMHKEYKKSELLNLLEQPDGVHEPYTPEQVDAFLEDAKKYANYARQTKINIFLHISSLTIKDFIDNKKHYEEFVKNVGNISKKIEKKYNYFYDIVDLFDFMNLPPNVKELEKIMREIYEDSYELYKYENLLDSIMTSIKNLYEPDEDEY
jgi:hypothetical protein